MPGGHVFISYASEDAAVAERIRAGFEQSGVTCWIAPRDIEPGTSFPAAITAAIRSCSALVLLLTSQSNQSRHVLSEVELAFNAGKPILAVLVGRITPSPDLQYFIATTHWFDADASFDDADMAKLHVDLAKLLSGERVRVTKTEAEGRRRRIQVGAAVAMLVVLVAAVYLLFVQPKPAPAPQASAPPASAPASAPSPSAPPAPTTGAPAPDVTRPGALAAEVESATKAAAAAARAAEGAAPTTASPARTKVHAADGHIYVWIPPGRFAMGCSTGDGDCQPDEMPVHTVRIARGFWLARTEVTTAQFEKRMPRTQRAEGSGDRHPAVGMDWSQAKAYCAAIGGRLPTEAEWEYAARAGSPERYYDTLGDIAWYERNSDDRSHPVGQKAPNAFGLYDMLGNVYEWVLDRYYNQYDDTSETVDEPLAGNASATARGGAWHSTPGDVRVSNRFAAPPDYADANVGLRCALNGP